MRENGSLAYSVHHSFTIDAMLNFNGSNNGHGLKNVTFTMKRLIKIGIIHAVTYWNCAFSLRSLSVAANDWKTGVLTAASSDRLTVIWGGATSGGLSLASVTLTVTVATSACVGSGSWTRTLNSIRRFPANRGFSKSIRWNRVEVNHDKGSFTLKRKRHIFNMG